MAELLRQRYEQNHAVNGTEGGGRPEMTTPLTSEDSLRIGTVDFVSPDESKSCLILKRPMTFLSTQEYPGLFPESIVMF